MNKSKVPLQGNREFVRLVSFRMQRYGERPDRLNEQQIQLCTRHRLIELDYTKVHRLVFVHAMRCGMLWCCFAGPLGECQMLFSVRDCTYVQHDYLYYFCVNTLLFMHVNEVTILLKMF